MPSRLGNNKKARSFSFNRPKLGLLFLLHSRMSKQIRLFPLCAKTDPLFSRLDRGKCVAEKSMFAQDLSSEFLKKVTYRRVCPENVIKRLASRRHEKNLTYRTRKVFGAAHIAQEETSASYIGDKDPNLIVRITFVGVLANISLAFLP